MLNVNNGDGVKLYHLVCKASEKSELTGRHKCVRHLLREMPC